MNKTQQIIAYNTITISSFNPLINLRMTFNLMIKSLLALQLISGTDTARKRWVGEATWSEPNNWNNGNSSSLHFICIVRFPGNLVLCANNFITLILKIKLKYEFPIGTSKLVLILIFNFQIIIIYHFAGLPNGCDGALIEPNQILTIAAQANIAEISFGGDSAIVFDSFSEIAFGQGGNYCNDVDTNIKFYEAARDDFLSVENWEADGDLDDLDLLDIHRIPCKLVFKTSHCRLSIQWTVGI